MKICILIIALLAAGCRGNPIKTEEKSAPRFKKLEYYSDVHCFLAIDTKTGKHYLIKPQGGIIEVSP